MGLTVGDFEQILPVPEVLEKNKDTERKRRTQHM